MKFIPLSRHPAIAFEHIGKDRIRRHVVVLRATYVIGPRGELTLERPAPPLNFAERAFGEMLMTAPREESDLAPEKPAVDVIIHANAYPPEQRATPRFGAAASVSEPPSADGRPGRVLASQRLVVTGPRVWERGGGLTDWVLSDPLPTAEVPLRFDFAYGGTVRVDDPKRGLPRSVLVAHPDNPVGRGLLPTVESVAEAYGLSRSTTRELVEAWVARTPRVPAPQVEHPSSPVRTTSDRPPLAGWGLVGKHWATRYQYAGTYDEAWMQTRYPGLPDDFDPRFWNAAHPALQLPALPEHAVLGLEGVLPPSAGTSTMVLALPGLRPTVTWRDVDRDGPQQSGLRLDTVICDLLRARLTLLYRFSIVDAPSLAWIQLETPS